LNRLSNEPAKIFKKAPRTQEYSRNLFLFLIYYANEGSINIILAMTDKSSFRRKQKGQINLWEALADNSIETPLQEIKFTKRDFIPLNSKSVLPTLALELYK